MWLFWKRFCMNRVRSLLSMHYMLRGYRFKLRPNSHAPGTVGSVITNGLLINRYSHSIKLFDEKKQDWLVQNFRLQQLQRLDTTQAESPFLLFSQEEHIRRVCSQAKKNLPMFAISNIHAYPCKAKNYKLSE